MQPTYALRLVLLVTASSIWVVGLKYDDVEREELPQYDDKCMMCLCEAVGKNKACVSDMRQKCDHQDTHGPLCISQLFWIDAGKPVLPGDNKDLPGAFVRCVEEPFCAVQTIRGYMETGPGLQDCDKNGYFDCRDLILTHLHGRYNCKNEPDKRVTHLEMCMGESLLRPSSGPPRQPVSSSGSTLSSSQGGRGFGLPESNGQPHGRGVPEMYMPVNSYGRGAAGVGNMNGEFGIPRNAPRDLFNVLHSSPFDPEKGVVPEDVISHSSGHMDAMGLNMRGIRDKAEFALRRTEDAMRNALMRQNPNPYPSYESDVGDSPTDSTSGHSPYN